MLVFINLTERTYGHFRLFLSYIFVSSASAKCDNSTVLDCMHFPILGLLLIIWDLHFIIIVVDGLKTLDMK